MSVADETPKPKKPKVKHQRPCPRCGKHHIRQKYFKVCIYCKKKAKRERIKKRRIKRKLEKELKKLGAAAVGISPDESSKQKKFDDKYSLGFPLLSDPDNKVAKAYGAWGEKSMYGKKYEGIIRSSFVIDEKGKILQTSYKVKPLDTVPNATEVLT